MKKQIKNFAILLGVVFALGGCSKDFLEEPAPTDSVTEDVVFSSRAGVEAYISGIHRRARSQFERTDTGGLYSMYFARAVKGNILINNGWFNFDYANDNREPTYFRTVFTWEFPYYMINQANALINGVEASTALSEEDKAELKAQGLALRAFYYFQLAMEFQHTYTYDATLPAPPIYTEVSMVGQPMSTLEEIYALIVSDLETAVAALDESRIDKSYINVNVAHGILARVYQVMHNWEGALEHAQAAYGGDVEGSLYPEEYDDGFDDMSSRGWIWALPNYADQTNYYWLAPHSFIDHEGAYKSVWINPEFVDEFADSDVRKLFETLDSTAVGTYQEYVTTKFQFMQPEGFSSDFPIMRTAEMILIEAEALYWLGQEDAAAALLYQLQKNRILDDPETEIVEEAVASGNTGNALLEEILLERRKELYAEIGVEWFDAKRLRRGITRDEIHRVDVNLAPDDKRFFLKIPQAEIDANEMIDASVNQNR